MTTTSLTLDARAAWAAHGFHGEVSSLTERESLVNGWLDRWEAAPDRPLLKDEKGWRTGRELGEASERAAAWFLGQGLRPGDRVVMSCNPSVDLVVAHVGALRAGLVVVPVNTSFTAAELANIVAESGARHVVTDEIDRADGLDAVVATPASVAAAAALSPAVCDELLERRRALRADDPCLLVFTSGTTGRPKGALLSHGNLLASAEALCVSWGWTADDRLVLSLPLFHMHGLGVGVHCTLLAGASAVIVAKFAPDAVLDAARDERATMLFGVPTMWLRLLDSPRVAELKALRLCVSGSAALAPDVWNGLLERGGQAIVERYGMTETAMNISNPLAGERRPGAVGLPLPGVEVRLDGRGPDGVGEIVLRGPNVFSGYWERPDANAEAFTSDGWFRSGDLGRVDPDSATGYVSIVGRSKDLIITGGYNVYPRDVEEVLREHPSVADAAVVGEPSKEWGETVTACVIASDGSAVDAGLLMEFAAGHLAGYQRPRRVVVVAEFPRNALGKVVKAELLKAITSTV